jgi:UDP-glucose 4-epimerase
MDRKHILVTGGAGYIGSCTAALLEEAGYVPIVLDNFSSSQRVTQFRFRFFEVDLTQRESLDSVLKQLPKIHAIFHFAAKALVPESTQKPWDYFHNNIQATLNMAECAVKFSIPYFIHSSTCAVYGVPSSVPIPEDAPLKPETPYGQSKLISETILEQYSKWKGLRIFNLRYFNPAGAIPHWQLGENHQPETHLIPNLLNSFREGSTFSVFGEDYPTPDGTCIRDLIHIKDLAKAHLLALNYLESNPSISQENLNIGRGLGTSVKEAITAAEKVLKTPIQSKISPKRPGDPPELVADISKMRRLFQWTPNLDIDQMIEDHWKHLQLRLN